MIARILVVVLVAFLLWAQAFGETWTEVLECADSTARAGNADSASALIELAISLGSTCQSSSDTALSVRICREGMPETHRFSSAAEAESMYCMAVRVKERFSAQDDPDLARLLNNLGDIYLGQGRYAQAAASYERALQAREAVLPIGDPDLGCTLLGLADAYRNLEDPDRARTLYTRGVRVLSRAFGEDNVTVAHGMSGLAEVDYSLNMNEEAESLYSRCLTIREHLLGPYNADVAKTLLNLAIVCDEQGKYGKAESLYTRALVVGQRVLGTKDAFVTQVLMNLAVTCAARGNYSAAEQTLRQALALRKEALGSLHPSVASVLNNLAAAVSELGRYEEAEEIHREALSIREQSLSPDDPRVALSLANLAEVCRVQCKYRESEEFSLRALAIMEKAKERNRVYIANFQQNLASLYEAQGRYAEAEDLQKRVLAEREKIRGADHPDIASSLNSLAVLYQKQRKFEEAESLHRRALAVREKALGYDHPDVGQSLNNLAILLDMQGRYEEAESLHYQALAVRERALGSWHPDVAGSLSNLAVLFCKQGRYEEADTLRRRALSIMERALGPGHLDLADNLESGCNCRRLENRYWDAVGLAHDAYWKRHRNFIENVAVLSEQDALGFARDLRRSLDLYCSCRLDLGPGDSATARQAADIVFSCKGVVSDGIFERQRSIAEEGDSTTLADAASLKYARYRLARLASSGPGEDLDGYIGLRDSLSGAVEKAESELSLHSASFRRKQDCKVVSAGGIVSGLPDNSTLVEYLKYSYVRTKPDSIIPHYLAVVATGRGEPHVVELGQAEEIEDLIGTYRTSIESIADSCRAPDAGDSEDHKMLAERIYDLVLRPFEPYASGQDLLLIAPDGALNLISFAGLMDTDSTYLIEHHTIHYLSAGRDLIRLSYEDNPGSGLLALGDPDYDAPRSMRLAQLPPPPREPIQLSQAGPGIKRSPSVELRGLEWERLAGSRTEVEGIAAAWRDAVHEPVVVRLDAQASEECLKRDAPGSRVVHLSTHGFYRPPSLREELPERWFEAEVRFVAENPLLRSGLVLAGANLQGERADSSGGEDGVVTALEVSGMDLRGTELVVLSACETGLGDVAQGEGVYGLRRAFQIAGARTVVSALWPVDDATTAEMMASLYERHGESLSEAMRRVQLEKLSELRKAGLPDHPFTWAAFVATGDWR